MRHLVTGGAGFIGSNLVDALLRLGEEVTVYDNFESGQLEFLKSAQAMSPRFRLVTGDVLDSHALIGAMEGCESVFHLAANADIRNGLLNPRRDLEQNTLATFNVLECMRACGISRLVFASSAAALGEPTVIPTPESCPMPIQTSLYGASKLACEGMIAAYCEGFGFEGYIFRFVSLLGPRYSHGHVFDFVKALRDEPRHLLILGDGNQRKSYLNVTDCVAAILHVTAQRTALQERHRLAIYHLGSDTWITVLQSAEWICEQLGVAPTFSFSGGPKGWIGDNPFVSLDTARIKSTGWEATASIRESIHETVAWLTDNAWIFTRRLEK